MEIVYSSHLFVYEYVCDLFCRCQQRFSVYEYVRPLFEYVPDLFHRHVISPLYDFGCVTVCFGNRFVSEMD